MTSHLHSSELKLTYEQKHSKLTTRNETVAAALKKITQFDWMISRGRGSCSQANVATNSKLLCFDWSGGKVRHS